MELAKSAINEGGEAASKAQAVIGHVLDILLRLLHPVMPFITETLWVRLTGGESLVIAKWPTADTSYVDSTSTVAMDKVKAVITEVRRFRSDQGLKPTQFIPGSFANLANDGIDKFEPALRSVLKLSAPESAFAPSASLAVGAVKIDLDLSGTVDVDAERARLSKDLATASKDRETAISKLENADFMAKAPEKVVTTIKERLATCDAEILRINERLSALAGS